MNSPNSSNFSNGQSDQSDPSGQAGPSKIWVNLWARFWGDVDRVGRKAISSFAYTSEVSQMIYLSLRAAFFDPAQSVRTMFSVIGSQIYFTGWQAMPLMTVLGLATGAITILQSATQLSMIGSSSMMGHLLVILIIRELGPLVTALIVIARSGTAVASEIGNMRVNREIDALEIMGINPLSFIVFPRLVGGVISVVCLAFYFDVIAILGGFMVTRLIHHMSFSFFMQTIAGALTMDDVGLFLLKNVFSGIIIFVVSCHQGMQLIQSSHEVPQVTTKAVVNSIIYVSIFNLSVTTIFYLNQLPSLGLM